MKTVSPTPRRPRKTSPGAVVALVLGLGFATMIAMGVVFAFYPRSSPAEVTGSINFCTARSGNYSPLNLDQCVNACISCDHGTMVTCSTACRLKGAL